MANLEPAYRPRKPSAAPTPSSLAERDAFTALAHQSLQQVQASAEAWRNGLTAFLTLITTAVIIKGRDTTAGLATSWRILITVLIGGGLALAVAGLWQVLAAQAGTRYRLSTRQDIHRTYHTIEAYHVALADQATSHLDTGRRLVLAALALLLTGIGVSWWAPPIPANPPTSLKATTHDTNACGTPHSADNPQPRPTGTHAQDHQMTLTLGISLTPSSPSHDSQGPQPLGACTDSAFKIPDRDRPWAV